MNAAVGPAPVADADYRNVAVLIPCYNEAVAIRKVVEDFRAALPGVRVYVFDNNSSDDSASIAAMAGAEVRHVAHKGKGNVVRRMFADVDADAFIMVDGDDTYDANAAPALLEALFDHHGDMVVGVRKPVDKTVHRRGHAFGNALLSRFLGLLFGRQCSDILSGYRAFSRRFVKSFPVLSGGFEIETELTVHALELRLPIPEIDVPFKQRPAGSTSKLGTFTDGTRIFMTMLKLFSAERPMLFYGLCALVLALGSIFLSVPVFITYAKTGLVPRFPTAILSTGLMLLAALSFFAGIILDTVTRGRRETRLLAYLAYPIVRARGITNQFGDPRQ